MPPNTEREELADDGSAKFIQGCMIDNMEDDDDNVSSRAKPVKRAALCGKEKDVEEKRSD